MNMIQNNQDKEITTRPPGFFWRPWWFLITRLIAVIGVTSALIISSAVLHIDTLHYRALWTLTAILFLSNVIYFILLKTVLAKTETEKSLIKHQFSLFTIVQINGDLLILTLMLHFSGGATNPFVFFYLFHPILASILLSKPLAYLEAMVASLLFNSIAIFEWLGFLQHYTLICPDCHINMTFILGLCIALTSTLFIGVYFATSIMDRLRMREEDLVRALDETERLETEKSHFMEVVVHDLKTPLASIETMISSALHVYGNEISPQIREFLERIPKRTNALLNLIQKILDFSRITRIDAVKIDFKPLNILPIVTGTVEMYRGLSEEKNISIQINSATEIPLIMGNQSYLERMVGNIVSNAIRYTLDNGTVTIKLGVENNEIVLTFADTGIGIPEDALPMIFNGYFRAPNAKKLSSIGSGLGLSITKAIVENHGGTILPQSTVGEGTIFTIRIPILIAKE